MVKEERVRNSLSKSNHLSRGGAKAASLELVLADDAEELDLEDEGGVRADVAASATGAVGEIRGDVELELVANSHKLESLSPATDDLGDAEGSRGVALVRGIELLAVDEGAAVVDLDGVAGGRLESARALGDDLVEQTGISLDDVGLLGKELSADADVVLRVVCLGGGEGEEAQEGSDDQKEGVELSGDGSLTEI